MKKLIKQEKGVTVVSVAIAIIIILIITTILAYSAKDTVYIKSLTNLYNDIEALRGKISTYYAQYGDIPARIQYVLPTQEEWAKDENGDSIFGANDIDEEGKLGGFYVIDLKELDGLTLNYGEGYESIKDQKGSITGTVIDDLYIINKNSHNIFYVKGVKVPTKDGTKMYYTDEENVDNVQIAQQKLPDLSIPENWEEIASFDALSCNYGGSKVNSPELIGNMKPIKYSGNLSGETNNWANAITADGSMWVWIPRFAYKITSGNHKAEAQGGTIEIAFINTDNEFLNSYDGDSSNITSNPADSGAGTSKWLVHPAFTANPENGGWDSELSGFWMAKFEATGEYDSETNDGIVSVKPGLESIRNITINQAFHLAKEATFGESLSAENLGSHMAKNSEWGAVAYLAHSKYGRNGTKISKNTSSSYFTGGSDNVSAIYTDNKTQSTTGNATGVYDMNGGSWEFVASYVNWRKTSHYTSEFLKNDEKMLELGEDPLILYGGGKDNVDLYGSSGDGRTNSTKYKTVYTHARNKGR